MPDSETLTAAAVLLTAMTGLLAEIRHWRRPRAKGQRRAAETDR